MVVILLLMVIRSSEEKLKTLMHSVWWFCFNYIQLLCGSNSYCSHHASNLINTGYGGYTVEHGMHIAQGNWIPEEAKQSSTWRELVAVGRVLKAVSCSEAQ